MATRQERILAALRVILRTRSIRDGITAFDAERDGTKCPDCGETRCDTDCPSFTK